MAHDVFISHSSKDKAVSDAICAGLEAAHVRCWVAPRDVPPGAEWATTIVDALKSARVMVLVFSEHSNNSEQVRRELTVAADAGVVIVPLKIDDTPLEGLMEYYLSNTHWLDAMNPPTEAQIAALVGTVSSVVGSKGGGAPGFGRPHAGRAISGRLMWIAGAAALLAVLAVGIALWTALRPAANGGSSADGGESSGPTLGEMEPVATLPLPSDAQGMALWDGILYFGCGENGLVIVDVRDPSSPVEIARYPVPDATAVDVENGYAYVAQGDKANTEGSTLVTERIVHVLDVSDPASPRPVAEYRAEGIEADFGSTIESIEADGEYLALCTWQKTELVDIGDPGNPTNLWTWETGGNTGITCHAAFIDTDASGKILALATGWEGLRFFDLDNPSAPEQLGVYSAPDWVADVEVEGGTLFASVGSAGLMAFDTSDPSNPVPTVSWEVAGLTADVRPMGERLFYTYWPPQDDPEVGSGLGRVDIVDAGDTLTTVRNAETLFEIGGVTQLAADESHLYAVVQGLGLFVYEPE